MSRIEIVLAILLLLLLCVAIKTLLTRQQVLSALVAHPLTHSLTMLGMLGIIPFFVTVEMGGRYGMGVVLALAAFGFIYLLAPVILAPIQFLAGTYRFPGIADIFVHRFRSCQFGKLACFTAVLASLPFAMAQLKAVAFMLSEYAGVSTTVATLLAALAMGGVALWISWHEDRNARTRNIFLVTLAGLSLFAMVALAITALFLIYQVFGNLEGMNRWVETTGQDHVVQRYEQGYALMTLFFLVSMVFPQLFSLKAKIRTVRHVRSSAWLFPLLLCLVSLPVFPLLWSGLAVEGDVPLQLYATVLPRLLELPFVSVMAIAGALAAAACGFALLSVALSESLVNNFFHPYRQDFTRLHLYRWLRGRKRVASLGLLMITVAAALLSHSQSLTDMVLVSFVGLTQLAPALLSTFYFPRINRKGVAAGLAIGLLCWFVSLFLPLFLGNFELGGISLGVYHWNHLLYEILFLNFAVCLLVSLFTEMDEEEQRYAEECMVDTVPLPQRVDIEECSLLEVQQRLSRVLGEEVAAEEIGKIVSELRLSPNETRPLAIRVVREKLAANLCSLMGAYAGQRIVEQTIPLLSGGKEPDDLLIFEALLAENSGQLSGLSAELNRLRLYHRTTLENLPIGVCSLDSDGEVLFWNNAMAELTGIASNKTSGALLRQLPAPWSELLLEFFNSEDTSRTAVKVPHEVKDQWCNLYKAAIDVEPSQLLGSQVLLVEDVTEPLLLNRELIHTERLASVGRLAAGVAHEIGNPITGIACLAQDLGRDAEDTETRQTAAMILDQTKRITNILRSLTSFSRRSHLPDDKFKQLPLRQPVESAVELLRLQQRDGVTFVNHVSDTFMVSGDLHQLTQVFLNLLTNASDASPANGVVTINAEYQGEWLIAWVEDQGAGIPEEIRDKIFEPFFTTKDTGEGTGLGLSLVYDIIRNHRGEIRVVERKQGACVEVKLPSVLATDAQPSNTTDARGGLN